MRIDDGDRVVKPFGAFSNKALSVARSVGCAYKKEGITDVKV